MIRILLADDHQLFIDGLKAVLKTEPSLEVVAQALNGEQVLKELEAQHVDIVLLDINMPNTKVLELTQEIQKKYSAVKIIILTMHHGTRYYVKLLQLGIKGYLNKSAEKQEVIEAIHKVVAGEIYISGEITDHMKFSKKETYSSFDNSLSHPSDLLTKREIEVLRLVVQEYTNNEIAEKLFISTGTVDTHRKNIILKLGVKNTVGLIKYAFKNGLIE